MPSKREVLDQLKRDELLAAVDQAGLEVRDRRVRGELIEALAASRKAPLAEILGTLSRTRLKEICRALDLDDSGREKALLVERLAGRPSPPGPIGANFRRRDSIEGHPDARDERKDLGGRTFPSPRSFRLVPRPQDDSASKLVPMGDGGEGPGAAGSGAPAVTKSAPPGPPLGFEAKL